MQPYSGKTPRDADLEIVARSIGTESAAHSEVDHERRGYRHATTDMLALAETHQRFARSKRDRANSKAERERFAAQFDNWTFIIAELERGGHVGAWQG